MNKTSILSLVVATIALIAVFLLPSSPIHTQTKTETAYDRVTKTNTLRCGYAIATPWFYIDPTTGEKKGYAYDVTMAVADKIGLKVDWTEETGWGVAEQGLQTGRYDMVCGSVCVDPNRNRAAIYSTPFEHAPILPVSRIDDRRFEAGIETINDPSVSVGVKNGHVFEYVAKETFPNARRVYANDISDDTDFFLMLDSKKIDIAFTGKITADLYEKENPGKMRVLPYPVRYCDGAFMMPLGEFNFKQMIDNALMELNTSGQLDQIAKKHMPLDPLYIKMPAHPYR
ncbi:MAG: substrate-binding periplasmic protein [Bdellovibrionales bacterium]